MSKPVVHFEIGCTDTAKAGEFYGSLFGWGGAQMGPAFMIQTWFADPEGNTIGLWTPATPPQ
jgi:predicted enzyme related to lactoylglutathione lyase